MVPAGYSAYFATCAGVAGALIGLLFVAVTLAPDRTITQRAPAQSREAAAGAFLVLADALFISLVALIPGAGLGLVTVVMAVSCTTGTTLFAMNSLRRRHSEPVTPRWFIRAVLTLALFLLQLWFGVELLMHPGRTEVVGWVAVLLLAWFATGLLRAWELLGGSGFRLTDASALWQDRPAPDPGTGDR